VEKQGAGAALGGALGAYLKEKAKQRNDQGSQAEQVQAKLEDRFESVRQALKKGKPQPSSEQQVIQISEKERELMETRAQIQRQLGKIVHRTWYIFDPEKKEQAKDTFKRGQANVAKPQKDSSALL